MFRERQYIKIPTMDCLHIQIIIRRIGGRAVYRTHAPDCAIVRVIRLVVSVNFFTVVRFGYHLFFLDYTEFCCCLA